MSVRYLQNKSKRTIIPAVQIIRSNKKANYFDSFFNVAPGNGKEQNENTELMLEMNRNMIREYVFYSNHWSYFQNEKKTVQGISDQSDSY